MTYNDIEFEDDSVIVDSFDFEDMKEAFSISGKSKGAYIFTTTLAQHGFTISEIPFPVKDMNLSDLDWIKKLVSKDFSGYVCHISGEVFSLTDIKTLASFFKSDSDVKKSGISVRLFDYVVDTAVSVVAGRFRIPYTWYKRVSMIVNMPVDIPAAKKDLSELQGLDDLFRSIIVSELGYTGRKYVGDSISSAANRQRILSSIELAAFKFKFAGTRSGNIYCALAAEIIGVVAANYASSWVDYLVEKGDPNEGVIYITKFLHTFGIIGGSPTVKSNSEYFSSAFGMVK